MNVCLTASLRSPLRSSLLSLLFGLVSFGFMTKAVQFILVQRETEILGSYYRSIGVLENVKDPQSGDISGGIDLIETSPYFAYGDQRKLASGVMPQIYNENFYFCNCPSWMNAFPEGQMPNVHNTDIWIIGELVDREEVKIRNGRTVGYSFKFNIDTLLAGYPEYARQGGSVSLLFVFEGHESAIPFIDEMEVGQRYFIRGWNSLEQADLTWENPHFAYLRIKPLDDGQLWYIPSAEGVNIDFSDPAIAPFKNKIDVLNENLHTLFIITTADMSAMPRMQEASRKYYLTAGRWLTHQDDVDRNKVIVVPESFARLRDLELRDEITFTFRPLTDTFYGAIRDSVDSLNWRSYPTYQDTFQIVGLYNDTDGSAYDSFIPTSCLRPGFESSMQTQFRGNENDYSFVLDSSRHETEFIQEYKAPLLELDISLTFLRNNGPAYWAAVDPIRRSLSADLMVFGLLLVVALILAVFLYVIQRKRDYAIMRALGVPAKQANPQLIWPLLLLGGLGIIAGGLPAWKYALEQARGTLSTMPTPAGVSPSADLSLFFFIGLCAAVFLLLALFSWLGVVSLAHRPVYELLQGEASRLKGGKKQTKTNVFSQPIPASSPTLPGVVHKDGTRSQRLPTDRDDPTIRKKYMPFSLSQYVLHHALRSRLKSVLTLAIALGFMLAAGWIRQTMERSRLEVERLYDTTVVEADIVPADRSVTSTGDTSGVGSGFVYRNTVSSVLDSGFVESSVLAADTTWFKLVKLNTQDKLTANLPVFAYDSPETFYSGLSDPGSITFTSEWNMDLFARPRTLEEIQEGGVPALFPVSLLEPLQLSVGERVEITDQSGHTYTCIIVGQYAGGLTTTVNSIKTEWISTDGTHILIPLSALEAMEGSKTKFMVAHFVLDPKKNRELPRLRADMEKAMEVYGGKLRFVIWDEELRIVIAQLERNLSILNVLYPVVIAVSVLIGAGLCFLLLLQATQQAAILRVLGTTRTAVRLALISEPLSLSIIGVVIGLGIARLLGMTSQLVPWLTVAGLYLTGALAGSVIGAMSVTNKKPIELLQVKE